MNILLINLLDCLCFTLALLVVVLVFNRTYRELIEMKGDVNFLESEIDDLRDRLIMLEYKLNHRGSAADHE